MPAASAQPRVALVGASVRALAQSAQRAGWAVRALDAFGDADTRAASALGWRSIAAPSGSGSGVVDAAAALAGLRQAAREGCLGWVPTSGFDGDLRFLQAADALLPRWGHPLDAWAVLRDPARFFGLLERLGVPHPEWRPGHRMPRVRDGWLLKDFSSAGGAAVQPLAETLETKQATPNAQRFAQRLKPGEARSLCFVADGQRAECLSHNLQWSVSLAGRGLLHAGVVGPVPLSAAQAQSLAEQLDRVVAALGLRGLGSVDYLWDGQRAWWLELNPRPTASLQLHDALQGGGRDGALPTASDASRDQARLRSKAPAKPSAADGPKASAFARHLRGCGVAVDVVDEAAALSGPAGAPSASRAAAWAMVWAPCAGRWAADAAARLADDPELCDLPTAEAVAHAASMPWPAGSPLCSALCTAEGLAGTPFASVVAARRAVEAAAQRAQALWRPVT